MRSEPLAWLRNLSDVAKISMAVVFLSLALGTGLGAFVYAAGENSRAGCYATHAVIRNLNDYFESQITRLDASSTIKPRERARAVKGYRGIILALDHVTCR